MKTLFASAAILVSLNTVAHAYDESRAAWWAQPSRVPSYYSWPTPPVVVYQPPPPISLAPPRTASPTAVKRAAPVTPDTTSASYIKGSNDRDAWEAWFNSLEGAAREGAAYYTATRSKPDQLMPCRYMANGDDEWMKGCWKASNRLTPIDYLRKTDAQYWNGWNKKAPFVPGIPGETPEAVSASSKPAVSTLSKEERDTNSCVRETRGQVGQFDAYYDPARNAWNTLGVKNGTFYFGKCMTERGHSIKFKDE